MATISKSWASPATIISAASVTTGTDSSDVDLETNGYEGAHVIVDADFPVTPTDNLIVQVYAGLDSTDYDDTPYLEFVIDNGTDPNQVSFVVRDVAHFKLTVLRDGSTDTITVTAKQQAWRWNSA